MSKSDSKPKKKRTPAIVSVISGGIAGCIETTATYPFEFAKTRVQLRNEYGPKSPRNPFAIVLRIWREEGTRAIYKGCPPLAVGAIAKDGIRFLSFDSCKNMFKDPETGTLTPVRNMLAGMAAGVMASIFAVTPTERIKTFQIDEARTTKQSRSTLQAIRTIYAEDGLVGYYRGFAGTTLKQAGATSFRMGSYNILKDFESKRHIQQSVAVNFANGAIAGLITTLATQPFDVIKTRSQSAKRTTTVQAFQSVLQDEGIKGFWRGTVMRLGRTILAGGILFTSAEAVGKIIEPFFIKPG